MPKLVKVESRNFNHLTIPSTPFWTQILLEKMYEPYFYFIIKPFYSNCQPFLCSPFVLVPNVVVIEVRLAFQRAKDKISTRQKSKPDEWFQKRLPSANRQPFWLNCQFFPSWEK